MPTYSIYALDDPRDGKTRYVGRTSRDIQKRADVHWYDRYHHPCLKEWLLDLQSANLKPHVRLLQKHDHRDAESVWMDRLIAAGHPLLNKVKPYFRVCEWPASEVSGEQFFYFWYALAEWPDHVYRRSPGRCLSSARWAAFERKVKLRRIHKMELIQPHSAACHI